MVSQEKFSFNVEEEEEEEEGKDQMAGTKLPPSVLLPPRTSGTNPYTEVSHGTAGLYRLAARNLQ